MAKKKDEIESVDRDVTQGPIVSVRFLLAILLVAAGIAYVVIWTLYTRDLRVFDTTVPQPADKPDALIPGIEKLKGWNWAIGFGAIFIGLAMAAHPKTPLGRGRGVLVGMLGCFVIGLVWICLFYVFADQPEGKIWLIGDLGQVNLMVGIGFMAVGFTYATRWE